MHALLLTIFIDTAGFGIVLPLLPFFAEKFGASPLTVTLLATVYSFSQFVFAPIWGRISDRFGRRPIILISLAGMFVGYVLLAFTNSLLMLFLARGFTGAMAANGGVIHAYVADVTNTQERAASMGKVGAAYGLGFIVGPAIGGVFAGIDPLNPNILVPFLIAASLSATAFIIAIFQILETPKYYETTSTNPQSKSMFWLLLSSLRTQNFFILLVLLMMTPFVFSGIETTFVIWSERQFGWGPWQNGWIYASMGLAAAATQWYLVGPLTKRYGEIKLIRIGALSIGLGCFLVPFTSGFLDLAMVFIIIVMGVSFNNPSLNSLISKYACAKERGSILGISASFAAMARIIGPAWAGFSFEYFGRDWPFFFAVIVMIGMLSISLKLKIRCDS